MSHLRPFQQEILCAGLKNTVPLITLSICRENILIKALWRYTAPLPYLRNTNFLIQNEPAWTLKKRVAEWFRDRAKLISVSRYIYKATINKDDIVAYTNCRKEYEVVQIGSVKDIQCIESPLDPKVRYLKKEISI